MKALLGTIAAISMLAATSAAALTVTGATEIAKPSTVTDLTPGSDTDMLWFLESRNSLVIGDREGLGTTGILDGTRVDTYMIFLNHDTGSGTFTRTAKFEFDRMILGLFGEANGADLLATDDLGGTTSYTNFTARGIENGNNDTLSGGGDSLALSSGNTVLDVTFRVTQPGDWVRVAVAAVPVPASLPLLIAGLGGLGLLRRRAKRA